MLLGVGDLGQRPAEGGEEIGLEGGSGRVGEGRLEILDDLPLEDPEGTHRRQLDAELQPADPQQEDVVGALRSALVGGDPAEAGHRRHRRPGRRIPRPRRPGILVLEEGSHRDQPVGGQRLLEERSVARLENVDDLHDVREHHQVWQREDPRQPLELLRLEGEWFVGHRLQVGDGARWISGRSSGSRGMSAVASGLATTSARQRSKSRRNVTRSRPR